MKKFLLLDHYAHHSEFRYPQKKTFTKFREERQQNIFSLQRFFEQNITWDIIETEKQTPETWKSIFKTLCFYDAIFLSGSPFSVNDAEQWILDEKKFLSDALYFSKIPVFGICFGHQLLADVLGGVVEKHTRYIAGETVNMLLEKKTVQSIAYHGEYIKVTPQTSHILAKGEDGMPYFVEYKGVREKIYGVQTHIEEQVKNSSSENYWKIFFLFFSHKTKQ